MVEDPKSQFYPACCEALGWENIKDLTHSWGRAEAIILRVRGTHRFLSSMDDFLLAQILQILLINPQFYAFSAESISIARFFLNTG
jgi:hypothetical protein